MQPIWHRLLLVHRPDRSYLPAMKIISGWTSHLSVLALLLAGSVPSARAADLVPHTALYRLTLDHTKDGGVVAATGRMAFEMIDACDGWAVQQHLDLTLTNEGGQDVHMVSDYTTFEGKDGLSLRFRMHQANDGETPDDVSGTAKLDSPGGPGLVSYDQPKTSTHKLPAGTLFPTAHTARILDEAVKRKKFLSLPLFDGTSAEGEQDSSVVMTGWDKPSPAKLAALANLPNGRVRIAFFDRKASDGSDGPDYEVAMRYFANGVADDMQMDFGDFVVAAKINKLTINKSSCN